MKYYIAFDGGGSKLQGVLFDETYTILAFGRSGGVNGTVHSAAEAELHMEDCLCQMLEQAGNQIEEIEILFASQDSERYERAIRRHIRCKHFLSSGEGSIGALVCGIDTGICVLSGTGSDVFYVRDGIEKDVIGGWGYLLSDDGSGVWIGQQALRFMMRVFEKLEQPGALYSILSEEYGIESRAHLYDIIYYRQKAPAFQIGSYCKAVEKAAGQGDRRAISILQEAGVRLAEECMEMIRTRNLPRDIPVCLTGSVFRYCRDMRDGFEGCLKRFYPDISVYRPMFEPVIGGIFLCMIMRGQRINTEDWAVYQKKYKDFLIEKS